MSDKSTLKIRRVDQLEALAHPASAEIVTALSAMGPSRVAQIAKRVSRSPNALYRHIKRLQATGLIVATSADTAMGRPANRYALAADQFVLDQSKLGAEAVRAHLETAAAALRASERQLRRRAQSGRARTEGDTRNASVRRMVVRVSEADLVDLNKAIDRLVQQTLAFDSPRDGEETVCLTIALCPEEDG